MLSAEAPDPCPQYFELLSIPDRKGYNFLRTTLSSPSCKNRRNKSTETFSDIIDGIKAFVVRGDGDDLKRSLVVGILWFDDKTIAINTRQLRLLLSKCKSSINGSFQNLGYLAQPTGVDSTKNNLLKVFPHLEKDYSEHRQWTVRQMVKREDVSSKFSEIIKENISNTEQYITPPPGAEEGIDDVTIGNISSKISILGNENEEFIDKLKSDSPIPGESISFENDEFANFGWDFSDEF